MNNNDLNNWKNLDVLTDSLWLFDKRDDSDFHSGDYHGNFIPQIPRQLMLRFTEENDVVLDTFCGSGTTLIEAKRLNRNAIGIELQQKVINKYLYRTKQAALFNNSIQEIICGDSADIETKNNVISVLQKIKKDKVKLIIMHPPYWDIIKYSDLENDLSNAQSIDDFTQKFNKIIENFIDILDENGHIAIVIGDKYQNSKWHPIGFYTMDAVQKRFENLTLKSIIIKNINDNRGKLNQNNIWKYRALKGGFYIFKHEYIFLFKKQN